MYLGLDLGTSSLKSLLIDDDQNILYSTSADIELSTPRSGWSEQEPSHWINALDFCLKDLSKSVSLEKIIAISFSGQMHGATCLDKNDQIIRPCILWNDTRSHAECSEILADPSVMDIAGNIVMPGFTAPKLVWLMKNEPQVYERTAKVLLPKDYLRFYLTGEYYSDLSDASGTYWLDVGKREWSKKLLEASYMTLNQMPHLCEGTDQTGTVQKSIVEKYGLNSSCKVFGGAGDNAAAAIGLGLYLEGNASLSLGTSGVIFGSTKKFLKNYNDAIHSFCHCIPNTWHLMSVMLSCTSNVNWFIKNFHSSIEEITTELNHVIKKTNLIQNSPFYLPYLSGERTPINDPHVRASFHRLGIETNRSEIVYSLIEGITLGLYDNFQALVKSGIALDNIYVIGGGSKNDAWVELLASAFDRDLIISDASDSMAAYGAARLALMGFNNITADQALSPPKTSKVIKKNKELNKILGERFTSWKDFYKS
ncbi:MAG: xylulokinase [Pelagibacteraceae bacterium]